MHWSYLLFNDHNHRRHEKCEIFTTAEDDSQK